MGSLREDGEALNKAAREFRVALLDALDASWIGRLVRWLHDRLTARKPRRRVIGSDGASRPEKGQP